MMAKPKQQRKGSIEFGDIHASIEDMKRQLDAIVKAMIAPQLGKNDREARRHLSKHIKTDLGAKIWNAIDGKRNVASISTLVSRKPQVLNKYLNRWELASPPLIYVYTETKGAKVYKRIYPIRMKAVSKAKKAADTMNSSSVPPPAP